MKRIDPLSPPTVLLCTLALGWAAASCSDANDAAGSGGEAASGGQRPNVVLIVIDTLRKDHLSAYGYERGTSPALKALTAEGIRFDRAISQAPWTTPSIASLLTSRYPSALGIRGEKNAISEDQELVSEMLLDAGYDTAAVISHSFLGSAWNFDQGFRVFDESNVLGHAAVTSAGVTDKAVAEVERMASAEAPFFLFAHYFDPHAAYVEQDDFRFGGAGDYAGPIESGMLFRDLRKIESSVSDADTDELRRLYDSEIAFTDQHLSRLFDAIRAAGEWDNTLVIVTADHGEEFLDHGRLGHAKSLFQELVNVPLLVKPPAAFETSGGVGRVVEEAVALVDVLPTILHVTDTASATPYEGTSLFLPRASDRVLYSETSRANGWVAAIQGRHKLLVKGKKQVSLYDLDADPKEQTDLASTQPSVVDTLLPIVKAWKVEQKAKSIAGTAVELDAAERERIENLGYGGDGE